MSTDATAPACAWEPDCPRPVKARGVCHPHYKQAKRRGLFVPRRRPAAEMFWTHVAGGDFTTCWVWTAQLSADGYGKTGGPLAGNSSQLAHRVAWVLFNGPIPEYLQMDHLCRNRACVNPWHLEPVTSQVNTLRGWPHVEAARRTHCAAGHDLAEFGVTHRDGVRRCQPCVNARNRTARALARQRRAEQALAGAA